MTSRRTLILSPNLLGLAWAADNPVEGGTLDAHFVPVGKGCSKIHLFFDSRDLPFLIINDIRPSRVIITHRDISVDDDPEDLFLLGQMVGATLLTLSSLRIPYLLLPDEEWVRKVTPVNWDEVGPGDAVRSPEARKVLEETDSHWTALPLLCLENLEAVLQYYGLKVEG